MSGTPLNMQVEPRKMWAAPSKMMTPHPEMLATQYVILHNTLAAPSPIHKKC